MHIPFCQHKCHYCDFNSHVRPSPPWEAYEQALISELQHRISQYDLNRHRVSTLFFGGGTPSLAPPGMIERIIDAIYGLLPCTECMEITLEANPGTVDAQQLKAFRQAGITRLSLGAQSLDDRQLQWLERIHDHHDVRLAVEHARQAGFDNLNLDLMYGLPEQDCGQWLNILEQALCLEPEHLSCYQLTVEPHTRLASMHRHETLALPDESLALTMLLETRRRLAEHGFQAYEVSNFSKPGRTCLHNDGYWLYHDYLGIGAGAAGKFDAPDGGVYRYTNRRSPEQYIRMVHKGASPTATDEQLGIEQAAAEAIWLGLRRTEGLDTITFLRRFGLSPMDMFGMVLKPHVNAENIEIHGRFLRATERGLALLDTIAADVLGQPAVMTSSLGSA